MQSDAASTSGPAAPIPGGLLASYFTLAGDVSPFQPPAISPISFRERAEAAGTAGFSGFGFHIDDLTHTLGKLSHREIALILADNGLVRNEVELLRDWFGAGDHRLASDAVRSSLLDAAERLGSMHVKVGSLGPPCAFDEIVEDFAELCDQAAGAGTAIGLEILPIGQIAELGSALRLLREAGRANGGLVLDTWHLTRGGADFSQIASAPQGAIRLAELCDGPRVGTGPYFEETVNGRLQCGAGEFDILGFISALEDAAFPGPFGVEILSDENRRLAPVPAAQRAYHAAARQFTRADRPCPVEIQ